MIRNYITIAFRNLLRNWSYAFLNIFGLTLGIASCLVIFLIVRNELAFDNFSKADRTYRVTLNAIDFNSDVSMAIAPAMRNDFPELEQVSQIWYRRDGLVKVNNKRFNEKDYAFADEHFMGIFNYQWIAGNPATALSEPNAVVLTETVARKYFGDRDAMGQVVNLDNKIYAKVTGIIKDPPANTSLPFVFLVSFETIKKDMQNAMSQFWWIGGGFYTYILLPRNYPVQRIESRIHWFLAKNWDKEAGKDVRLPLQPLKDIHFDQRYINNVVTPTSKNTYYALFGVALLIIITACINFINLATVQAIKRAKEVGVRKVLGARRSQLIKQFIGETTVLVLFALVIGIALATLFLSRAAIWLNIRIDSAQIARPMVIEWIIGLTVLVILVAGLYPAFVQSAFHPVDSLKSSSDKSSRGGRYTLRKSLVVAQFAISQILIVGTLVVARQMDFFQNQDLGFNKEAVVSVPVPDSAKMEIFHHELLNNPGVVQVSLCSGAPAYNNNFNAFSAPQYGLIKNDVTEVKDVDENYIDMFGLQMLAGTKIAKTNPKDTVLNIVVNETLIRKLGIMDPQKAIGKRILFRGTASIVGVVKDFQSESKHKTRRACILEYRAQGFYTASMRLRTSGMSRTIDQLGKSWSALFPNELFQYEFLDDHIASLYAQEQKEYTAFKFFSCIAILIGCLGLYGLIAFAAAQRSKEIGIRKVLGAPIISIVGLFSMEFITLITIAFAIAAPLGYYLMHSWLQNYAYHIHIGAGIFLDAILVSLAIAGLTIGYQTIKAAMANPVKSLRSE